MEIIVNGEQPFRAPAAKFCIGQTSAGYTLNYSVDGEHYTAHSVATDANTDMMVANAIEGMFIKLVGNTDTGVKVIY